ncbi:hypothetical protein ACRWFL_27490, partial [Escherichia coli]
MIFFLVFSCCVSGFSKTKLAQFGCARFGWQITRQQRATEKQRIQNIRRRAGQRDNFMTHDL